MLALATMFVLANGQERWTDLVPLRDMVLNLPVPDVYWILGSLFLAGALVCLFGRRPLVQLMLALWLAVNLIIYRVGFDSMGGQHGSQGYLGDMASAFGLPPYTVSRLLDVAVGYLFVGSLLAMVLSWMVQRRQRVNPSLKMACAHCGGHIEFYKRNLGQTIGCPHCRTETTLRHPAENLKMNCFFCKEHIEFPAHSLGYKIKCPHCKKDITLKEPASL